MPVLAGLLSLDAGAPEWICLTLLTVLDAIAVWLLALRATADAVPRAVAMLIAAICIVDALAVATHGGGVLLTAICAAGYVLTRLSQSVIPGT